MAEGEFINSEQGSNLTVPEGGQSGGGVSRGSGSNARAETPELTRRPDKSSSKKGLLKVLAPRTVGKRQSEFLKFFKEEIPENEPLIADFSCALVRDILVQGRLFLTPNYCCFHSNILRWETSAVIPFTDITSISKEKTIKIIPNAISVVCHQNKYIFTSFTARDRALHIFTKFWRFKQNRENKNIEMASQENEELPPQHDDDDGDRISQASNNSEENLEPPSLHHEDKLSKCFLDVVFPIPIDTLFSLVWLTDSPFWKKFMTVRKTKNWYAEEWSEKDGEYQRECRCLQHVQLPMGAKDVPQVDNHTMIVNESGRKIVIDARTYIREVPYGPNFHVLNRWQFLKAENNRCRVRVATQIVYDKACWQVVKTFIDKNAYEGNQEFMEGFRDELNRFIESGSVHPSPTLDDLTDETQRERNGTKISVKKATPNPDEPEPLPEAVTTPPHVPNLSYPRGIDHSGAIQHWAIFLFFFVIGILLYTSWSFNARLNQLETRTIVPPPVSAQQNENRVEELLLKLIEEVRHLRSDLSSSNIPSSSNFKNEELVRMQGSTGETAQTPVEPFRPRECTIEARKRKRL
ncbi:Oidioi.mRNA.OKI2018_I69.PAR.g9811.t1.cds [Oikopleura dioica]|uniref:Oidioi.mRNA.OKI2018_I69.PAR.g9811.t1.cds n=1 Tax=Oikopleura dioica TaxID=34765 RepID=A0ABN7RR36_OIKDI|nr:Oidioi.mRNA.OKI2018_I69.PAR.g9811.t1.cds [Oikopleura dioica]